MLHRHRRPILAAVAALAVLTVAVVVASADDPAPPTEAGSPAGSSGTTSTTEPSTTTASTTTSSAPTTTTSAPPASTSTTTGVAPPATTTAPTTTVGPAPEPPFQSSVTTVTAAQLGSSWKPGYGCPSPDQLRMLHLSHWGYDGAVHQGRLVVAASHASRVVAAFRDLYAARFPIQRMVPIDAYGGDDQASMRANNTSGFNCRYVSGTTTLSQHGLGLAVDVNPLVNPYVKGGTVDPPEGAPYADRTRTAPGMIHAGDAAVDAFARQGWRWGGYWSSGRDYQHFSASGG